MGGSITYVYRDGSRLTPWMLYQVERLSADLHSVFGVRVLVSSGIRTYAEQEAIFRARYVTAGNVNGRKVYDTRVWNGVRWYRISPAGTVAVPGTSNHEIQGSRAAVDLRDTGADAGIATGGSARSNWLRARAADYDLIASGFGFGEAWHYDVRNIFNTPPAPSPTPAPEPEPTLEELMSSGLKSVAIYTSDGNRQDGTALDFENGFKTSWSANEQYSRVVGEYMTEGGTVKITASHYDRILADFEKFFKEKREHELAVARAAAGK